MADAPTTAVVPPATAAPATVVAPTKEREPNPTAFLDAFTKGMEEVTAGLAATEPGKKLPEAAPAAPVKTEPVKSDEKPDPIEDTSGMMPRTREKFDKIKASREEWKTKATAGEAAIAERDKFKAELETLKAKPPEAASPVELEAIKKERDELSERLRILDIERHPQFKAHWDGQIGAAENAAKSVVGAERAVKLERIFNLPDGDSKDEQLEALAAELTPTKQGQLGAAMMRVRELQEQRAADVTKSKAQWDKIQAEERAKSEQGSATAIARRAAASKQGLEIAAKLDAFRRVEGDTAQNDFAADGEQFVKAFFDAKLPDKTMVTIPALAYQALHLQNKVIPALRAEMAAEIKKRDDQIASLTASNPRAASGAQNGKPAPKTERKGNDVGSSFIDTFNAEWKGPAPARK